MMSRRFVTPQYTMTSSLRNSLHRRNHKERSQLAHRSRLGILEKHKDYVKRARDYHSKQERLQRLRQKAAGRNKDEFYFSMIREKTRRGVHIRSRANVALPTDTVKLLKTQDENYVRTMRSSGLKKINKIKNQLTEIADLLETSDKQVELDAHEINTLREANILRSTRGSTSGKHKHILFATSTEDASRLLSKGKETAVVGATFPEQEEEEDLGWKPTEPHAKRKRKKSACRQEQVNQTNEGDQKDQSPQHLQNRKRLLTELSARLDRDRKLRYAQREFEMQRLMMGKGARKKIRGVEKVELDDEGHSEDEDEIDAHKGKRQRSSQVVDEETYRPRVYKWRLERRK